jgi:tetratricopeptide (TPR) repeat protein
VTKIGRALKRDPTPYLLFHLAAANAERGNFVRALELNEQLETLQPKSPEQMVQKAFLLQALGRMKEAEAVLLESARREPFYMQTYGLLGNLWAARGERAKALSYFETCVARMPNNRGAREIYAHLLASNGDGAAAESQWRAILKSTPDDEGALVPLAVGLYRQNRGDEALGLMLAAYAYNPHSFENNGRLEQIYAERGDIGKTVEFMKAMADSGPVKSALHADLSVLLLKLGRDEEAKIELVRARQAAQEDGDEALLQRIAGLEQKH